jgi:hypothetical protein
LRDKNQRDYELTSVYSVISQIASTLFFIELHGFFGVNNFLELSRSEEIENTLPVVIYY